MMGDKILPKRSPNKHQRLVMINSIYHVKYSVRNSLDEHKHFQYKKFVLSTSGMDLYQCINVKKTYG